MRFKGWIGAASASLLMLGCAHSAPTAAPGGAAGLAPDFAGQLGAPPARYHVQDEVAVPIVYNHTSVGTWPSKHFMIDGDPTTRWRDGYQYTSAWAAWGFWDITPLTTMSILTNAMEPGTYYHIQISNDGVSWKTVWANQNVTSGTTITRTFPAGTSAKFVRLLWYNSPTAPVTYFYINEVSFTGQYTPPTPQVSSTTLPPSPPWPLPADLAANMTAAGLAPASVAKFHDHSHVDIFYNGDAVTVPALLGLTSTITSPLHTHKTDNVIHCEGLHWQILRLDQLFTEWGVPLDSAQVYVNGNLAPDWSHVPMLDYSELAIVFGTPPAKIPSTCHLQSSVVSQ